MKLLFLSVCWVLLCIQNKLINEINETHTLVLDLQRFYYFTIKSIVAAIALEIEVHSTSLLHKVLCPNVSNLWERPKPAASVFLSGITDVGKQL